MYMYFKLVSIAIPHVQYKPTLKKYVRVVYYFFIIIIHMNLKIFVVLKSSPTSGCKLFKEL